MASHHLPELAERAEPVRIGTGRCFDANPSHQLEPTAGTRELGRKGRHRVAGSEDNDSRRPGRPACCEESDNRERRDELRTDGDRIL